jgi:hypothetical protein
MTVAEINALLYFPNHPHALLERALRIEALSKGWRGRSRYCCGAQPVEMRVSRRKRPCIQRHRDFTSSR